MWKPNAHALFIHGILRGFCKSVLEWISTGAYGVPWNCGKRMKPEISVLMPVYNAQLFLVEAVQSILNQSFTNFELIIIDDGSTDDSPELLSRLTQDSRILLLRNDRNRGLIYSLNLGLARAKGRFIARMDADDVAYSDRFANQLRFLTENPDMFLVAGSFNYIDSSGRKLGKQKKRYTHAQIEKYLLKSGIIHHPTVMFRHQGDYRYREKARFCEDRDLWLRMLSDGRKMHIQPDIVLDYRLHPGSVSALRYAQQAEFIEKVVSWYRERKKMGYDSYDSFDPETILAKQVRPEMYLAIAEMKILFKSGTQSRRLRLKIMMFWKQYGVFSWFPSLVLFPITFLPSSLGKRLSMGIVRFYE